VQADRCMTSSQTLQAVVRGQACEAVTETVGVAGTQTPWTTDEDWSRLISTSDQCRLLLAVTTLVQWSDNSNQYNNSINPKLFIGLCW